MREREMIERKREREREMIEIPGEIVI